MGGGEKRGEWGGGEKGEVSGEEGRSEGEWGGGEK